MKIVFVNGSLSEGSSGTKLCNQLSDYMEKSRPDVATYRIDLRSMAHEITDAVLTGFAPAILSSAQTELQTADAVVAVTPTFQASMSGLFKMFFDVLPDDALKNTPVLLAATGGSARHGLVIDHALRPLFTYLGALPIRTGIFAATQDWGAPGLEAGIAEDEPLERRIKKAANELMDTAALCPETEQTSKDPMTDFIDFETLLGH